MATIERDVVLESVDENGNPTIDFPITRKDNIEDFPESMPANGGDSDTVDGKHASDFAAANHTHSAGDIGAVTNIKIGTNYGRGREQRSGNGVHKWDRDDIKLDYPQGRYRRKGCYRGKGR